MQCFRSFGGELWGFREINLYLNNPNISHPVSNLPFWVKVWSMWWHLWSRLIVRSFPIRFWNRNCLDCSWCLSLARVCTWMEDWFMWGVMVEFSGSGSAYSQEGLNVVLEDCYFTPWNSVPASFPCFLTSAQNPWDRSTGGIGWSVITSLLVFIF